MLFSELLNLCFSYFKHTIYLPRRQRTLAVMTCFFCTSPPASSLFIKDQQTIEAHYKSGSRIFLLVTHHITPCSGVLWMRKLKTHLLRTQSSKVLPLRPGLGQKVDLHAWTPAWNLFLANFYLPSPFTFIFFQTSPKFVLC